MEIKWWSITAVAPVAWGANYLVIAHLLPPGSPLWGAALRATPAAVLLLLWCRSLPHGHWWWRSTVLGVLNVSAFFLCIHLAGGVVAMLGPTMSGLSVLGLAASASALVMFGLGGVLSRRWVDDQPLLHVTAWQLALGSLTLLPVAAAVEGAPPRLDAAGVLGVGLSSVVATALAYLCWFGGLRRLPAGSVGVVGLLNPVTGVALGVLLAGERLGPIQVLGVCGVLGAVALAVRPGTRTLRRCEGSDCSAA